MQQVVSLEYLRLIHRSKILDNIWTRFLGGGGDLYVGATYRRVYTVYCRYIIYRIFSLVIGKREGVKPNAHKSGQAGIGIFLPILCDDPL